MKGSKKKGTPSENQIQNAILTYLSYRRDIFAWRNNNHGVYDSKAGTYRRASKYSLKGVADILGITDEGRFIALEVKRKSGRPSSDQLHFISRIEAFGGIAGIVNSVEDVVNLLKEKHDDQT